MTSDQRDPYVWGDTRATMAGTKGSQAARRSQSQKAGLSSDRRLQLAYVKLESLVIADQQAAVNLSLIHISEPTRRS